jgi:hypothetical protein
VNRLLKAAAFVVVALYFTVDAAFSYVTKPLVSWTARKDCLRNYGRGSFR